MRCEDIRDELISYLKGELDEEMKNEIDEHLARCKGCRRELEVSERVLKKAQAADDVSIIRLANSIIIDAIEAGASDIHWEPMRESSEVRYRIDGILHTVKRLPREQHDILMTRLRSMAKLPWTETQLPSDGRIPMHVNGRDYDGRLSIVPYVLGEKAVLRLFDCATPLIGLDKLDLYPEQSAKIRDLLHQPHGLIVITGPAGSGKTTLAYSMLEDVKSADLNIATVEDPVELVFEGMQQIRVAPKSGMTFGNALRAIMRQDPDVVMASDMRDTETVVICTHLTMTGHLVIAGLHAEDAISVPQRLIDFGAEPWSVGGSLIGVIATRLVQRVCLDCREEYTPSSEALESLGLQDKVGKVSFQHGAGCDRCRNTGYRGRVALHEILTIDRYLAEMIRAGRTDPDAVLRYAVDKGFTPIAEDARRKILEGQTTAEAVYNALMFRS